MKPDLNFPRHCLGTEHFTLDQIAGLFDRAEYYLTHPKDGANASILSGRVIANLFFENSTRTQTAFEIAAWRLGARVSSLSIAHSSISKGETVLDTAQNLRAMGVDAIVMRHPDNFAARDLAAQIDIPVINAGDGTNEHPTQGLLDVFTMQRHKKTVAGLRVAICGDIAHSRVARSNIHLLLKMGAVVHVIAPPVLMPEYYFTGKVQYFDNLSDGIRGVDVVMMLRIQKERMQQTEIPGVREYAFHWGLDHQKLKSAKPDAIVMHPGPINRGVELDAALADDPKYSVILDQVKNGVAIRTAIFESILGGGK